tara:strand:- start:177 stop:914 length:738 start_codon:yes stop_codon:yes gene_type:complete
MIESILTELGLSDKEILVYLEIVKSEAITATQLSKNTKLHRPTVYDIIEKLIEKGLITQALKAKKKFFQPTDFNKFLSKLKEQEELAHLAVKELNKLRLPLSADYKVEVFEGKEGQKSFYDHIETILRNKELRDYLVLGSNLESIKKIKYFLLSKIKNALLLLKNVDYRVIFHHKTKKDLFRKALEIAGKHKFLPEDHNTECTTIIFNDFVALMFDPEKPVIVRIQNKMVAETYRNHFEFIWNRL